MEICVAAISALLMIFLPFAFFGGFAAASQWISNALSNAAFYSSHLPMWGAVPFANHFIDSNELVLPSIRLFAAATQMLAVCMLVLCVCARRDYRRLLYIGSALAFMTHHDYGGAYLIPAFVAWLGETHVQRSGLQILLEASSWFLLLTPLQIPTPFMSGTLNAMLQNESLFVLIVASFFSQGSNGKEMQ